MDPSAIAAVLNAGPYGVTALAIWWALSKDKKIDEIRQEQIRDTKVSLETVSKSLQAISEADDRQLAQIEASKELVAMIKVLINKGQL